MCIQKQSQTYYIQIIPYTQSRMIASVDRSLLDPSPWRLTTPTDVEGQVEVVAPYQERNTIFYVEGTKRVDSVITQYI